MNCKFFKECRFYNPVSLCCRFNTVAKNYYEEGRPAGCYRMMLEKTK
jgi:hypothetical protein